MKKRQTMELRWRMPQELADFIDELTQTLNTSVAQMVRDLATRLQHQDPVLLSFKDNFVAYGLKAQPLEVALRAHLEPELLETMNETLADIQVPNARRSHASVFLNGYFAFLKAHPELWRHGYVRLPEVAGA